MMVLGGLFAGLVVWLVLVRVSSDNAEQDRVRRWLDEND